METLESPWKQTAASAHEHRTAKSHGYSLPHSTSKGRQAIDLLMNVNKNFCLIKTNKLMDCDQDPIFTRKACDGWFYINLTQTSHLREKS